MVIEVVYGSAGDQIDLVTIADPDAMTVASAVEASGLLRQHPEIAWDTHRVSIYGKRTTLDASIAPGDRIEILRPLTVDPMTARRLRAKKQSKK